MRYKDAIRTLKLFVPSNILFSLVFDYSRYEDGVGHESRQIYLGPPIDKTFFGEKMWQDAIEKALDRLREEGLI